uniref:Uncharacterized protein n=1 Tax=Anguilla anguilla TaxID=7936 RepID=A0A0E9Q8D3_ANGAN
MFEKKQQKKNKSYIFSL